MSFPVDLLNSYSHEDLEGSGQDYMSGLRSGNPNCPDFFSLPDHRKIPVGLSTVGFLPIYGEDLTHKVLALFAPEDLFKAVALYLADRWWSIDDILRTSVHARQGLHQVKSLGERIVLYVLNRIIYRTQEMGSNDVPFLCHSSNAYAKIMWQRGEAIGFYSVKPKGSVCTSYLGQNYRLSVLDTMFVRKQHRGKGYGLLMLEDFVDSFTENALGLRYPLSDCMYKGKLFQYFEKYPGDRNLLWEVEGVGHWFQKKSVMVMWQKEKLSIAAEASQRENNVQAEDRFQQSAAVAEASGQNTEVETKRSVGTRTVKFSVASVPVWTQISHLKRPRIGKNSQESQPETFQGDEEKALRGPESRIYLNTCCRLELAAHASESPEDSVEVPEESTVEEDEITIVANVGQPVSEAELHVSPPEKQSEEENPSEPLNGEVTEETGKTLLTAKEETGNEVLSDESKLQTQSQEEPVMLFVPLILESQAKPSEDTVSEKALNANDSEVLTEVRTLLEKEGTEEQRESEKTTIGNAAASSSKEEPSDNGLPNSMVTEAAAEPVSPKRASSLEDQNEEEGHNSQEASVTLSQSSLIVVELEGVPFQQPSGQEGQKNQLEEHSEESAEQVDQYMRAADSSSEEAEIEVPIVDRRNLRRKAKGYKGPPKKKGKPA
ncbi:F169A protein, partial [Halcyon senegalensis]|nr:F169A protein [Halcyon senegalensis]